MFRPTSTILSNLSILSTLLVCCLAAKIEILADQNFKSILGAGPVLVRAGAPWCVASIHLKPQFETAVHVLSILFESFELPTPLTFAEVDGTSNPAVMNYLSRAKFPTIALVNERDVNIYNGDRSDLSIVNWVIRTMDPSVKTLSSTDRLDMWKSYVSPLFVLRAPAPQKSFQKLAKSSSDAAFVEIVDSSFSSAEVSVYRSADNFASDLKEMQKIDEFVNRESTPVLGQITPDTYRKYLPLRKSLVWFVGTPAQFESAKNNLIQLGRELRRESESPSFVWLSSEKYEKHAWSFLGVTETPALVLQKVSGELFDIPSPPESLDLPTLQTFLDRAMSGSLPPKHRSESSPPSTDIHPEILNSKVPRITARGIPSSIFESKKDSFLAVLAPWGLESLKMEQLLEGVKSKAKKMKVKVMKIDGHLNDLSEFPGFEYSRYPAAFYFIANQTIPIPFNGLATSEEALMAFIRRTQQAPLST